MASISQAHYTQAANRKVPHRWALPQRSTCSGSTGCGMDRTVMPSRTHVLDSAIIFSAGAIRGPRRLEPGTEVGPIADTENCNSSMAPLAADCCFWAILAVLCSRILICGQAVWGNPRRSSSCVFLPPIASVASRRRARRAARQPLPGR
jgi:hypothetical protein